MENSILNDIWQRRIGRVPALDSQDIIKKAVQQRKRQQIGMAVMCLTAGILICYAVWQFPKEINWFITGLFIMISSLIVRIAIEYYSKLRKVSGLLNMNGKQYLKYLKSYYHWRKRIHFAITPICFGSYVFGLWQLFPYFKTEFSSGFYTYLIISGALSLTAIAILIIHQIKKELRFLRGLTSGSM